MNDDDLAPTISEPPPIMSSGIRRAPRLDGAAILLVDADAMYVDAMTLLLRMDGAQVRAVSSSQDAVRAIAKWRPNVLLCDPSIVDARVHFALRVAGIASILKLGATPEPWALSEAHLEPGYDQILGKPFDMQALVARIAASLCSGFGVIDIAV